MRNRYTLDIYEQNNYLQNYPVRLLLALRDLDKAAGEENRLKALDQLETVCNDFYTMRRELEAVYSRTRFMEQPDGYISDMNHHNHLSAKSNNSDWLYLYEKPMVEKILNYIEKKY